jgi:hypothetical protein
LAALHDLVMMAQLPMKRLGVDAVLVGLLRLGGLLAPEAAAAPGEQILLGALSLSSLSLPRGAGEKKKHQLPFDNS